jgi:hypothetical protein
MFTAPVDVTRRGSDPVTLTVQAAMTVKLVKV